MQEDPKSRQIFMKGIAVVNRAHQYLVEKSKCYSAISFTFLIKNQSRKDDLMKIPFICKTNKGF